MKQTEFSKEIMLARYAFSGETTWEEIAKRVSSHIAKVEANGEIIEWKKKFYEIIESGDFIPGGRILYGSGRRDGSLLNCFALGVEDNRYSIAKLAYDMYLISVAGGGVGYNVSKIRPKGDPIQGIDGSAPGVISEMKKIDSIGKQVRSGGGRRTALLSLLSITHPDVLEYINVKVKMGELVNHNISVAVTKDFIKAVKKNKPWKFYFNNREYKLWKFLRTNPDGRRKEEEVIIPGVSEKKAIITAKAYYKSHFNDDFKFIEETKSMAKDLWHTIISNNIKSGEPGFIFVDNIEENFNANYFEDFTSTNPCGEIPLPSYGNCCLGSINVNNFYDEKKNDVNWSKLAKTIHKAVRFLDNVLTANIYPIPETKEASDQSRRIGLGVMGLHYLLIKLGFKYGHKKSLEFIERFFTTMRNETYEASIEIAKEKGIFPGFNREEFLEQPNIKKLPTRLKRKIKKYGIRNVSLSTIPPTGTTSMVAGVSSGLEPIFAPLYKRKYKIGNVIHEELVMDSMFAEYVESGKNIKNFVGAYDITPEEHLAVQMAAQEFVDNSISKTINLPANFTSKELEELVLDFADHLKGMTIYQAGSRGDEPLQAVDWREIDKEELLKTASRYTVNLKCESGLCEL